MSKEQLIAIGASFVIMLITQAFMTIRQVSKKIDEGDRDLQNRINRLDREKITRDDLDREIANVSLVIDNEIKSLRVTISEMKDDLKTDFRDIKTQNSDFAKQITSRLENLSTAIIKANLDK